MIYQDDTGDITRRYRQRIKRIKTRRFFRFTDSATLFSKNANQTLDY